MKRLCQVRLQALESDRVSDRILLQYKADLFFQPLYLCNKNPSSERWRTIPGIFGGSKGDLLSTSGTLKAMLCPTTKVWTFFRDCFPIRSICLDWPRFEVSLFLRIFISLLFSQQELQYTGDPYPSMPSTGWPQITWTGLLQSVQACTLLQTAL